MTYLHLHRGSRLPISGDLYCLLPAEKLASARGALGGFAGVDEFLVGIG